MNFPPLKVSSRSREYKSYSQDLRDGCVYAYLFDGMPYRLMDRDVLSLDPHHTRGFQSMGILHHYGLTGDYRGYFMGKDIKTCISELDRLGGDFVAIADSLRRYIGSPAEDSGTPDGELESIVETGDSEGKKKLYYTTRYERSRRNREAAIRIHGARCMACGFDFGDVYGDLGDGFIEVHHIRPLSSRNEEVVVDPEKDLVCLCSNCHRMVHHIPGKVLSVEELRIIISRNRHD